MFIHAKYCTEEQRNLHTWLVGCFDEYKVHVETDYGKKPSLLPANTSLHIVPPRTLTKHYSVDNVIIEGQAVGTGTLTKKSQSKNDNA